jgi:hypothetical protein
MHSEYTLVGYRGHCVSPISSLTIQKFNHTTVWQSWYITGYVHEEAQGNIAVGCETYKIRGAQIAFKD